MRTPISPWPKTQVHWKMAVTMERKRETDYHAVLVHF